MCRKKVSIIAWIVALQRKAQDKRICYATFKIIPFALYFAAPGIVDVLNRTLRAASRSVKLRLHLVIVARCQLDNITSIAEQGCWGGCLTINHPPRHYSTCLIYIRALYSVLQRSVVLSVLENAQLTSMPRHPSDLVMYGWRSNYRCS